MARPFYRLRFELAERDIDQHILADKLHRGDSYISDRMTGKGSWTLWEAFEMMKIIGASLDRFTEYFPPGDVAPPEKSRKGAGA